MPPGTPGARESRRRVGFRLPGPLYRMSWLTPSLCGMVPAGDSRASMSHGLLSYTLHLDLHPRVRPVHLRRHHPREHVSVVLIDHALHGIQEYFVGIVRVASPTVRPVVPEADDHLRPLRCASPAVTFCRLPSIPLHHFGVPLGLPRERRGTPREHVLMIYARRNAGYRDT